MRLISYVIHTLNSNIKEQRNKTNLKRICIIWALERVKNIKHGKFSSFKPSLSHR